MQFGLWTRIQITYILDTSARAALPVSDAFDLHVSRMRADRASALSIATITRERDKYLANWMNRPLEKIERSHCRELHEQLSKQNGPYLANRVMLHIRAAWNTALKEHDLPANPTIAVHWNEESQRQEPIPWANLPAWLETVNSVEPIVVSGSASARGPGTRGDYRMFLLLTGLRRMDRATVRWEHLDLDEGKLHRPNPKDGKERAFNIPLSSECMRASWNDVAPITAWSSRKGTVAGSSRRAPSRRRPARYAVRSGRRRTVQVQSCT